MLLEGGRSEKYWNDALDGTAADGIPAEHGVAAEDGIPAEAGIAADLADAPSAVMPTSDNISPSAAAAAVEPILLYGCIPDLGSGIP